MAVKPFLSLRYYHHHGHHHHGKHLDYLHVKYGSHGDHYHGPLHVEYGYGDDHGKHGKYGPKEYKGPSGFPGGFTGF